jgi:hypothetical protein
VPIYLWIFNVDDPDSQPLRVLVSMRDPLNELFSTDVGSVAVVKTEAIKTYEELGYQRVLRNAKKAHIVSHSINFSSSSELTREFNSENTEWCGKIDTFKEQRKIVFNYLRPKISAMLTAGTE